MGFITKVKLAAFSYIKKYVYLKSQMFKYYHVLLTNDLTE